MQKDKVKLREYIIIDNKQVDIKGKLSATAYKNSTFSAHLIWKC